MFASGTIFLSAIAALLIGALWYHPKLFGSAWVRLVNITPEALEGRKRYAPLLILVAFILALILSFALRSVTTMSALYLWAGIVVPVLLGAVLWEGRSLKLFAINAGYWLITFYVITTILRW